MSNLIQAFQSVKAEFTIGSDGQVASSIRGVARLVGIAESSLREGARNPQSKLAETLNQQGFDTARIAEFATEGIPDTAIAVIAQYYAFVSKKKTTESQQLCMAFMAVGIRAWVHEQLGWQQNQQPVQHHRIYWERLRLFEKHTKIPNGYWCVFAEIGRLMRDLETGGVVLPSTACPDISVGICWNAYLRKEKKEYDTEALKPYPHHYPDHRGVKPAKIYPNSLMGLFHDWLSFTYIPGKFPNYVEDICPSDELELIAMAVGNPVQLSINSRGHKFLGMARQG